MDLHSHEDRTHNIASLRGTGRYGVLKYLMDEKLSTSPDQSFYFWIFYLF